jgi:thioredoxin reductase (NADPH)
VSTEQITDITIIGGGPTGLAAAYYGGHRDASVRIVESLEQLGGQVSAVYPEKHIFDVAGFPKVNGQELINRLIEQAQQCSRWWSGSSTATIGDRAAHGRRRRR